MNLKEIKELMDAMTEKDIADLEIRRGNERVRIRRGTTSNGLPFSFTPLPSALPHTTPLPPASAPVRELPSPPPKAEEELHIVKSPIVGTFYDAAAPGAAPFVQVGDTVRAGQVVCIIEAMKLMNEIESDVDGVIEKRFVSGQQPVEYGEALFGIRKKAE